MDESNLEDEDFKVGDVLVSDRFKNHENVPHIFKTHRVDKDFGVVYFKYKGKEDTIGMAYVRKATFIERMFDWLKN